MTCTHYYKIFLKVNKGVRKPKTSKKVDKDVKRRVPEKVKTEKIKGRK